MKANTDKQIEKLVDKMLKETTLEKPSFGFTTHVMTRVLNIKTSHATIYKPLISKWVWYGVFASILGLMVYLMFNESPASSGLFEKFNLNALPKLNLSNMISKFHFSKSTVYACVLLTFMLFVQIPILKHYINKRFEE